nr:hypothetical protein [Tanacetum cinerariifolium]
MSEEKVMVKMVIMDDPNITIEKYIRFEEEKARRHGKVYNWETTKYGKTESDKDNADDEIDIEQSSRGNVINVNDGAYAHGSNKLLVTSHDTSNKFFKTKTFIKEININIMAWNNLNDGMLLNLIKNLYVPFGIPFDPKLFYNDGVKLEQV